ncbi:MAG: ADP-forming succinate--CoA ligase subunit beta [Chloroflexi bacterium]|nr:ADP-forming succinate--CoA ligase subunit beta [Chloroflexota bacterium]
MKLHEYQARDILAGYQISVPAGGVASTAEGIESLAETLGGKVVIKAQVQVGGRGKAGGVKLAMSPGEAREIAQSMLDMSIKGLPVRKLLVAEALDIQKEYYLGAVLDRSSKSIVLMASAAGGIDIEEIARVTPEKIAREAVDPLSGLWDYQGRALGFKVGLDGHLAKGFSGAACGVYRAFIDNDASLVEINPLVITHDGRWIAADAKIVLDDNALFRHPNLENLRDQEQVDANERKARAAGLSYVRLDGNIGCIVNGAGLAMATMDIIKLQGGEPANFLDIGGGAKPDVVANALRIVLGDHKVAAVLVNIFGGITRCDDVARGILSALADVELKVPMTIRLTGTNEDEGRSILGQAGFNAVKSMDEAAQMAVRLAGGQAC